MDNVLHRPGEGDDVAVLDRSGKGRTEELAATEAMVPDDQTAAREGLKRRKPESLSFAET